MYCVVTTIKIVMGGDTPPFKDNLDPKQVEENVFWGIDFCYLEC